MSGDKSKKWISVVLLCVVNLLNYMDRYTVPGVLSDIEEEFRLEHWQSGLLQTAFVACFFASAPLFGFMGDRVSRKWILVAGTAAWGICSLLASFAQSYYPFLTLRAAIGFGESAFTTVAPTVLGDLFAGRQRSLALAVFYLAIPLGGGLGYVVGSMVSAALGGWRLGLRVTPALVGVAVLLMVAFLQNPRRGESEHHVGREQGHLSWSDYVQDLAYLSRNRSFLLMTAGFTCLNFFTGGLGWWAPIYLEDAIKIRAEAGMETGMSTESVSVVFGAVLSVAGLIGLPLGTLLSFRLRSRIPWVDPLICGASLLLSAPFCLGGILAAKEDLAAALSLLFVGLTFLNMNWAIIVDVLLYVVVPSRRSSAEAVQMMFAHALGEAGSPYLIGLLAWSLSESLKDDSATVTLSEVERDYQAFQYSFLVPLIGETVGAIFFLWAVRHVVRDRRAAEQDPSRHRHSEEARLLNTNDIV